MFGFIPFIESFFLLSLGITFVLIFLMVFHFKQRIEKLEKKNNNLSDLSNKIVKEITNLHSLYLLQQQNQNQNQNQNIPRNFLNPKEHISENIRITTSIPITVDNNNYSYEEEPYKKIVVMDTIVNDDIMTIESDSYGDEDDDDDDLESNDSESIFVLEEVNEFSIQDTKEEIHLIKLYNDDIEKRDEEGKRLQDISDGIVEKLDKEEEEEIVIKEEKQEETIPVVEKNNIPVSSQMDYRKMNISNLRILAISKGLCSDTSKIKRADLIKLLESESESEI
jgi:hypothetical protein